MSAVVVVGAGVVGQVYAGLLADAGHRVCLLARGCRAEQLRRAGVSLERDGVVWSPACEVITDLNEAGSVEVIIVAVRGDQLASVQALLAAARGSTVVCLANPLGRRGDVERQVGVGRTVFAFSGIGGAITDEGVVRFHVVRQQPTVVDVAATRGGLVERLLASTGLPVRPERQMSAWLDTHNLFIAGIGAAVLAGQGCDVVAGSRHEARELVAAIGEAFDAVQSRGHPVRPGSLRAIFGRVPLALAARYWQRQFAGPTVRVSIAPHVLATRHSEFPQVVDRALDLVGSAAPRYRRLVGPCASSRSGP